MALINRELPSAQNTKVVYQDLGALKTGSHSPSLVACDYDAASSKPTLVGRDVVDARCKTCSIYMKGINLVAMLHVKISNMSINCSNKFT